MNPSDTPALLAEKIMISELPEGREATTYFLCTEKEVQTDKNGKAYLRLKLRDATGDLKSIHFDPAPEVVSDLQPGDVVHVGGTFSVHPTFGPQFQIKRLRIMEAGEYDEGLLVPVSPIGTAELAERLTKLVDAVTDPHLHALLELAIDPSREPGASFSIAPAAVKNHHAYLRGLLEHSIIVGEVARSVASNFADVDLGLVVTGALLHDVGKTESYSTDMMNPGFTDAGRLHGEIVIGHDIVRRLTEEVPGFPAELAVRLRHIIISHHGEKEKGSPVIPATREAVIVHYCDDMTARVGAIEEALHNAPSGNRWSGWVGMIGNFAYVGDEEG